MPRVKKGVPAHKRHRRVLTAAKGYWGGRRRLYKSAKDTLIRAMRYSTRDRKIRKREFRRLWIARINAAARAQGVTYSHLIKALIDSGIELNRKQLAEMAMHDEDGFRKIVQIA